ncbi:MAG: LacI family DNA-binding transcriptional regulator [Rhodobacteraceae bacterium]|nr:LacI family DNA-binding transcriptional regulator [Paracoccaceae bacterium]
MKKRILLVDVAEAAKVLTTTVSLVLRDSPQIPPRPIVLLGPRRKGWVYLHPIRSQYAGLQPDTCRDGHVGLGQPLQCRGSR